MYHLLGNFFGGFLIVALIAFIIARFAFKHDDPDSRAFKTAGLAYLICAGIALFGMGVIALLLYLPGAFIVMLWQRRTFNKAWSED